MKLLMISTDKKMFEAGSEVARRQIEFAKNFEEVHIIVFAPKTFKEMSIAPNVWVYPTRVKTKVLNPWAAMRLGRFIIKRRGITNITVQDPFLTGMSGISLKKEFSLPLEIQVHTDIGSPNFTRTLKNRIFKSLSLSYLPQADHVRVVSDKIKNFLTTNHLVEQSKIEVRPIFVDTEKIKNTPVTTDLHSKYPQFEKLVLVASRLEEEKNVRMAIEAWPEVISKLPKAGLIIVGKGSEKSKLEQLVNQLNVSNSVIFEDWADVQTLVSYYKTADVFVNTSWYEGYGMTLVEAHAAGCPIVSTDVGVAREVTSQIADWRKDDVAEKIVYALKHGNS